MSSFTFILHVPDRFYGFWRLKILHKSRTWIEAAPKSWKIAHKPRLLYTTLRYAVKKKKMALLCIKQHPSSKFLWWIETEHKTQDRRSRDFLCEVSFCHRNWERGYYCAWHILDNIDKDVSEKVSFLRGKTKPVQAGRQPPRFHCTHQCCSTLFPLQVVKLWINQRFVSQGSTVQVRSGPKSLLFPFFFFQNC